MSKELYFLAAIFFMGVAVTLVFSLIILHEQNQTLQYYKIQSANLCNLSNQYRGILVLKNPEIITSIPTELDCNKITIP